MMRDGVGLNSVLQEFQSIEFVTDEVPKNSTNPSSMSIEVFCQTYKLSDKITKLLQKDGYETTSGLLYTSDEALLKADFKAGQIAELKRALKEFLVINRTKDSD
jgi:hypothetical protein